MVIDTSALLAILFAEPEAVALAQKITESDARLISAVSLLEASIVVAARKGSEGTAALDEIVTALAPEIVPFDASQADVALNAWRNFGKGRHPAGLNFGDCCSYALARSTEMPLLYKGNDFGKTDVISALAN